MSSAVTQPYDITSWVRGRKAPQEKDDHAEEPSTDRKEGRPGGLEGDEGPQVLEHGQV
ncbi:MAG: hypothetical protein JWM45_93, partial [Pseudonocardiales bacterium]|nr:hypothetical protein [Pseudonocardiales bacterium]